jgi:hypothetical protein
VEAVDKLTGKLQFGYSHSVVEAASKGFFDHMNPEWLVRMVAERLEDRAFLGLIRKWLRAGILDTMGAVIHPVTGTPQGGVVSPVLSNGSLHYGLDLGFEKVIKPPCRGEAWLLRYADDYICAVESKAEAERFYAAWGPRREKVGLTLATEKSRLLPFSRHQPPGQGRFEFLGVEFYWGRDRGGKAHRKPRTARAKLRASLQRFTQWCRENRHRRLSELFKPLNGKLRGYYNYYGVHGNSPRLQHFFDGAVRIRLKWRNRRSQRPSYNWQGFKALLTPFKIERPRLVKHPQTRKATATACAGMRKRVGLKSPVRENRTPGSVRGPLGNWRSYRDGISKETRRNGRR